MEIRTVGFANKSSEDSFALLTQGGISECMEGWQEMRILGSL